MSGKELYFFDSSDGDWFMIPKKKENLWEHVKSMDSDDPKTWVAYEQFDEYRVGGDISRIYFISDGIIEK